MIIVTVAVLERGINASTTPAVDDKVDNDNSAYDRAETCMFILSLTLDDWRCFFCMLTFPKFFMAH